MPASCGLFIAKNLVAVLGKWDVRVNKVHAIAQVILRKHLN
jgi:hypothetical protein